MSDPLRAAIAARVRAQERLGPEDAQVVLAALREVEETDA